MISSAYLLGRGQGEQAHVEMTLNTIVGTFVNNFHAYLLSGACERVSMSEYNITAIHRINPQHPIVLKIRVGVYARGGVSPGIH